MIRTALVTGAGQRLGHAIAKALVAAGYAVAIHYNTSREPAEMLAAEISADGGRAAALGADLAKADAAAGLLAKAVAALGPVGLLVNSASLYGTDSLASLDGAQLARLSDVNFRAPVLLMQAFAAQPDAAGAIVNMLDVQLDAPSPDYFSYFCSKAALAQATRLAALELAPRIRVNAIAPGLVLPSGGQTDATFAARQGLTPLGAGLGASDIAGAVLFLAEAHHITGHVLPVDSGQRLLGFGNTEMRPG